MNRAYKHTIKPLLDFVIATVLFIILLPVIVLVALLLLKITGGKPFFTQERPGQNAEIFRLIKFRTMLDLIDSNGLPLPDNQRLTKIGKWIRASSLDELPQLINVLKGEMSLVGPRPLLVKYLPLYSAFQNRRHEVKPGITGWTQVNGRNSISWDKKFELDVWYVDHLSFKLDLKILWLTVIKVIKREDINSAVAATMPPFTGSK